MYTDGGYKCPMETCKRGHAREKPNVSGSARARGYFQCKACVRANATIQYHPYLKERIDEIADIHYENIMGNNIRLSIENIEAMLSS